MLFVVMDTCYYDSKINDFLSDTTKFIKIYKNPTLDLKRKLNKHISTINAVINGAKLNTLIEHFEPAYICGNPKIHKKIINPPMRPIVSQIGAPTAQVADQINEIIVKYMPKKYMVKSLLVRFFRSFEILKTLMI